MTAMFRTIAMRILIVVLSAAAAGCTLFAQDSPEGAVRRGLERTMAHDLLGASASVCLERRDPQTFPFGISGIFAPVGAMPGYDVPRTLAIIDLDATALEVVEVTRAGDEAEVAVRGTLVEHYEPAEVEALFRAYARESGEELDQALLEQTLAATQEDFALSVDESVRVIRQEGQWRVCPLAPTP